MSETTVRGRRSPVRLAIATTACLGAALVGGCSTSATRTEGAGPIDNVGIQTNTRCTIVKDYQLFLYTADLKITGKSSDDGPKVAEGLKAAGLKVQGAIPEFSPYVNAITTDRVARLTGGNPPQSNVNVDDARQIVGTYQSANCPESATPGVAPPSSLTPPK